MLFDYLWVFFALILSALILMRISLRGQRISDVSEINIDRIKKWDRIDFSLFLILFILITTYAVLTLKLPVFEWDTRILWGVKARILSSDNTIISDAFLNPYRLHIHPRYPLLFPVTIAALSGFGRAFHEYYLQILVLIFSVLGLQTLYQLLSEFADRKEAMILLIIMTMTGSFISGIFSGGVEVILLFYLLLAIQCITECFKNRSTPYFFLTGFFLFCCASTKNEGLLLTFCIIMSLLIISLLKSDIKIKAIDVLCVLVIFVGLMLIWFSYMHLIPPVSDENYILQLRHGVLAGHLHRLPIILKGFWLEISNLKRWHIVLLSLPVLALIGWEKGCLKLGHNIFLFLILLFYIIGIAFIYYISPWRDTALHIKVSLNRVLLPVLPVCLLFISRILFEDRAEIHQNKPV